MLLLPFVFIHFFHLYKCWLSVKQFLLDIHHSEILLSVVGCVRVGGRRKHFWRMWRKYKCHYIKGMKMNCKSREIASEGRDFRVLWWAAPNEKEKRIPLIERRWKGRNEDVCALSCRFLFRQTAIPLTPDYVTFNILFIYLGIDK